MRPVIALIGVALVVTGCAASAPAATTVATPRVASASPNVGSGDPPSTPASVHPPSTPTPPAADADSKHAGDSWVKAGALVEGRSVTRLAVLDETDEVLAVGADVACGLESDAKDTTELYDMHTGMWRSGPRMPSSRHGPAVAALGSLSDTDARVLVTGGSNQEYVAKSSTVLYDPNASTWSRSGLLNTARIDPAIAVIAGGRVLVAGGLFIDVDQEGRALDSAEIWDPGSGTWTRTANLSGPRYGAQAATLDDGSVLVVGGLPTWGADDQRRSTELYDPLTGRWMAAGELADIPAISAAVSLAATSGGALALYASADGQGLRAEWFDPGQMAWSPAGDPDLPRAEGRPAMVTLLDGRVLVVSGEETRIFEPQGTWTRMRSIPDGPRNDASAVLLPDGSVLVAGGWSIGTPPDDTGGCETPNPQAWRYISPSVGDE